MAKPIKTTLNEIATAIVREGVLDRKPSSLYWRYYTAFGQRWLISYSPTGIVKSVEQVREDGSRVWLGGAV